MAELTRRWEDWLHPIGTLCRDDLEEIERILSGPMSKVTWRLKGAEGMRSADVEVNSFQELVDLHGHVRDPEQLELEVREYDRDGESFLAVVGTSDGDRGPWYVRVSGSRGNTDRCESSVDGVSAVFGRATQTSWARKHKLAARILGDGWWGAFAFLGGYGALVGFFALVQGCPWIAAAVAFAYVGVTAGWFLLDRRVKADLNWEPPKFNVRLPRTLSTVEDPPEIWGTNATTLVLGIVTGVVIPIIMGIVQG